MTFVHTSKVVAGGVGTPSDPIQVHYFTRADSFNAAAVRIATLSTDWPSATVRIRAISLMHLYNASLTPGVTYQPYLSLENEATSVGDLVVYVAGQHVVLDEGTRYRLWTGIDYAVHTVSSQPGQLEVSDLCFEIANYASDDDFYSHVWAEVVLHERNGR